MKMSAHSSRDDFNAQIQYLENLGYRERRHVLWHRNKPRLARHIYKFREFHAPTTVERLRDILLQNRLRLASPKEFNDPFDMAVKIVIEGSKKQIRQRLDTVLKQRGMKWPVRRREIARVMRNFGEGVALQAQTSFRDTITAAGVCSFGGDPRSILMWSHYADCHSGVCLQFEVARDLATFAQALPVNYSKEYPVLNWVNERKSIVDMLLRKYVGWKYEQEHRIVIREAAGQFINFRPVAPERTARGFSAPNLYRAFTDAGKFRLNIKREKNLNDQKASC
jgi:hypothetical protein